MEACDLERLCCFFVGTKRYARVMRPLIALSSDARALPAVSVSSRQDRLKERLASEHQGPLNA